MEENKNISLFSQVRNGSPFLLMEFLYRLTPVAYLLASFAKNGSDFDRCGPRRAESDIHGIMYESLKIIGCIFPSK